MPVIHADQAAVHTMHGTSFTAYASPDRGSQELCAWRIEIPGHTKGIPHHVSREEVLYVLGGTIQASVDGRAEQAAAGDVILVPAGAKFGVDNLADGPATAWVTTSVGFRGVLPDGSWIARPGRSDAAGTTRLGRRGTAAACAGCHSSPGTGLGSSESRTRRDTQIRPIRMSRPAGADRPLADQKAATRAAVKS